MKGYQAYVYDGNIDSFHEWVYYHPVIFRKSSHVWDILFRAFRTAEDIHKNDTRANGRAYIHHPIELVQAMMRDYGSLTRMDDLIALILHDTIEDHPESWLGIYQQFGIQVFRDVLILSKLSEDIRRAILQHLVVECDNLNDEVVGNIMQILDPNDPLIKLCRFSHYAQDILGQDTQRFQMAISFYNQEILDKHPNQKEAQDEYISLGNYLYFTRIDVKRKLQDMLNNMSDMKEMEERKLGYIEKRRIKAYILGVKLRNFGLNDEFSWLQEAFHKEGYMMYTDSQVREKTKNLPKILSDETTSPG